MAEAGVVIAVLSLCIALLTAWLTLFRRGRLAMTKPTIVFFGFDQEPENSSKIFMRALLYSTAIRGQVIEGMFANLLHKGDGQVFSYWAYGETNQLVPGSGLYVGQTGIAANHHFVRSAHQPTYEFTSGDYTIEIFARLVGKKDPKKLAAVRVSVTDEHATILARRGGVLFELNSNDGRYVGHARD